jgi:hypothetical protein
MASGKARGGSGACSSTDEPLDLARGLEPFGLELMAERLVER